jgi:TRAP-type C4-dicarboxylate transport system permease small subunit
MRYPWPAGTWCRDLLSVICNGTSLEAAFVQILLFTVVGIVLYFLADWVLRTIERLHGNPLPHRGIIYFVIILCLALLSFQLLQHLAVPQTAP